MWLAFVVLDSTDLCKLYVVKFYIHIQIKIIDL